MPPVTPSESRSTQSNGCSSILYDATCWQILPFGLRPRHRRADRSAFGTWAIIARVTTSHMLHGGRDLSRIEDVSRIAIYEIVPNSNVALERRLCLAR